MRPIDGDRLKAFLDDTEKTLKRINTSDQASWDDDDRAFWDIYIHTVGKVFAVAQNAIDWMPTLETRGEN